MNEAALKLTTYFGERDRTEGGLVADALLDLYGREAIRTSVLVRGAGGFGRGHQRRTDRLLSLSEDLPTVSVAVDRRERIEAIFDEVVAIRGRGLVTLERARILSGDLESIARPEYPGAETKLTIYLGRRERVAGTPAFVTVCDLLHRRGLAGATVLLGVDGTAHGHRRRARFLAGNADVPLMIIAVGAGATIARVLPELGGLLREPLATLERIRVCKRDGVLHGRPGAGPAIDKHGLPTWEKLMVYNTAQAKHGGVPTHIALLQALRESGARGATNLRGVWGFHGDHRPHGDRLLQVRRHVPVVTVVIDSPGRIARSFEVIDAMTAERGLVTSEKVPAAAGLDEGIDRGALIRLAGRPR